MYWLLGSHSAAFRTASQKHESLPALFQNEAPNGYSDLENSEPMLLGYRAASRLVSAINRLRTGCGLKNTRASLLGPCSSLRASVRLSWRQSTPTLEGSVTMCPEYRTSVDGRPNALPEAQHV